jgi:hypothetical protein
MQVPSRYNLRLPRPGLCAPGHSALLYEGPMPHPLILLALGLAVFVGVDLLRTLAPAALRGSSE